MITLITESYQPDSPTHDVTHLARVAALGKRISLEESADQLVVVCAAWLHDLHRDRKLAGSSFFSSPEDFDDLACEFMRKAEIPQEVHRSVLEAIHHTDRFSFSDRIPESASLEARCLRDADNLDAIGAIGVARAFCFGGSHDIPIWTPEEPLVPGMYNQDIRPSSTLHHFHEKLIRLEGEFETSTAKRMAHKRSAYLTDFAEKMIAEWNEDFQHDE